MEPFEEQNPDLDVKTASFASDEEAAAKLNAGFQADVVESCLDEMSPLTEEGLLRPLDPAGVPEWENLSFTDAPGVTEGGKTWVVPLSAGPQGLIVDTEKVPDPPHSWKALFDPKYEGEASIEGDYELPAIAEAALAMGIAEPMKMTEAAREVSAYLDEHVGQFRSLWQSDSDLVNLFKSGEIVISDGGPGVAARMVEAGIPVEWIAPEEGPALLGLRAQHHRRLGEHRSRLPADQLAGLAEGAGDPRRRRLRPHQPDRDRPGAEEVRPTADPSTIKGAIAESRRPDEEEWVHVFQEFEAQ